MENFELGSIWRKWNLHLHSKYSGENRTKMEVKNIFDLAISKGLSMISITDHSNVNALDEIWDYYENGEIVVDSNTKKINELIEFLPGIELSTTSGGSGVHIISIFPKEVHISDSKVKATKQTLQENFCSKLNLTKASITSKGNNDYDAGLLMFKVDLDVAVELTHALGGIVIIHGGSKDRGIEKEMTHEHNPNDPIEVYNNLGMQKTEIMKKKIDVIELPNINKSNAVNMDFYHKKFGKPCIISSDSHTKEEYEEDIEKKSTWIKADLSFLGFKQSIIDYQERIFLKDKPEQLENFENNKTKYVSQLSVDWADIYKGKSGTWFKNLKIPFNYGLISIIGNKGSGKTAIAEIVSLIGNTKRYLDFNFLTSKKFHSKNLSSNFIAETAFFDGKKKSVFLNDKPEQGSIELVQFIPQNYFETICNSTQYEMFTKELNQVVFSRMAEEEKEGANSFEELVSKYENSVNKEINFLRGNLSAKNEEIIKLENKKNPIYKKELENQFSIVENEEKSLLEIKPAKVAFPKMSAKDRTKYDALKKKQSDNEKKIKEIIELNLIEANKFKDLTHIKTNINDTVNRLVQEINDIEGTLAFYDIEVKDVLSLNYNFEKIEFILNETSKKMKSYKNILGTSDDPIDKKTLFGIKNNIRVGIEKIVKNSQEAIVKYEKNQEAIKQWNESLDKIKNSKKRILQEITYIEGKLKDDIDILRKDRVDITEKIFLRKNKMIEIFNNFKRPIDDLIELNRDLLDYHNLEITSGHFVIDGFENAFFDFINKNRKNVFRDEGYVITEKINNDYNVNEKESVKKLVDDIIIKLESDNDLFIHSQIKERKTLDFYNYIFGLDFIEEKYNLSTLGKSLDNLSPGERGALLLVFYLLIDDRDIPLILDQPEDNLDNQSISTMLVPFIKRAKKYRQIIVVTHNPNISIVSDSDQIIWVNIDKSACNTVKVLSGAIENPLIKDIIVEIQEGTEPSFKKREEKYGI